MADKDVRSTAAKGTDVTGIATPPCDEYHS